MISNQSQKSGDSSTNIQAQQMVVHVGIDEKRAREICHEMNLQSRKDFSQEALNVANSRVAEFENILMPKMAQVEGALEAFADPSFQLLLVEAQKAAASTERPVDYDLLSELLMHRFQKGGNRIARAGISLAVEIVDKVSDEALLGLTVGNAIASTAPLSGNIHEGLNALNDVFGKILYGELPTGDAWLDHLDVLDAIRINPSGVLKKISLYYSEVFPGYFDEGIAKNSIAHERAIEMLKKYGLPQGMLVEHALNFSFVRIPVVNISDLSEFRLVRQVVNYGRVTCVEEKLSEVQEQAVRDIYNLYSKDESIKQGNINVFMSELDKRGNLKTIREWWDNIPTCYAVTSVGKVLAHSNAQRCKDALPSLG
ncbi:hypothetical protein CSQ90_14885 [Janthinobacterium sp. BJB303]|nr:hypothetical protein CSQ90_14885 [Janthinobacterium sp. BJB303]